MLLPRLFTLLLRLLTGTMENRPELEASDVGVEEELMLAPPQLHSWCTSTRVVCRRRRRPPSPRTLAACVRVCSLSLSLRANGHATRACKQHATRTHMRS